MTGPVADPTRLDGVASACALLSNLFLRQEAGPATVANLDRAQLAQWPLERDPDTVAGLGLLAAVLAGLNIAGWAMSVAAFDPERLITR